jgi:opacity protein-like surface antigen
MSHEQAHTCLTALLLISGISKAQLSKKANLNIGFEVGEPLGEFDDNYNGNPAGLGINLTLHSGVLPVQWGFDFGYASMGSNNQTVEIQDENLDITEGNMKIKNNICSYHANARFKPWDGFVAPYIEGLAGLRSFSTKTKIEVDGLTEPNSTERNSQGITFSYGWAAGLMFNVSKLIYLEGRFEKLRGSNVEYVDQSGVQVNDNGNFTYETKKSNTKVANIYLGIGFRF